MSKYAIIVAGGSGSRMGSTIPKQFMLLEGKPILVHTIDKFLDSTCEHIVVVLPTKDLEFWAKEVVPHFDSLQAALKSKRLRTVAGGATRYQSVKNGLDSITSTEGLVAIHDGVRPFISATQINKTFDYATKHNSAVLAVKCKDSVRLMKDDGSNQHVDRIKVKLVQTPQTFNLALIKAAFELGEKDHFTDDASVFEYAGHQIHLIEGSYNNIKITTPEDIEVATQILRK